MQRIRHLLEKPRSSIGFADVGQIQNCFMPFSVTIIPTIWLGSIFQVSDLALQKWPLFWAQCQKNLLWAVKANTKLALVSWLPLLKASVSSGNTVQYFANNLVRVVHTRR